VLRDYIPVSEGATKDQVRVMLQTLFADRFKAVLHHETREFPIFELTVAKSGSKLRASSSAPPAATGSKGPNPIGDDGFPQLPPGARGMIGARHNGINRLIGGKQTLEALAKVLENEVGSHVVDKTGLAGSRHRSVQGAPARTLLNGRRRFGQCAGTVDRPSRTTRPEAEQSQGSARRDRR
jgi:uncharacterized protein (TIGR03435 family)